MYGATATTKASQNGWPASADPAAIEITTLSLSLRNGTKRVQVAKRAADAFTEIIRWWDSNVEPVETLGGYNFREIRGYEGKGIISNHGSGTAIDINAEKHPLGATDTIPLTKRALISAKAASLGLRWGGDYRNRKDAMHFEVILPPTADMVRAAATETVTQAARKGRKAARYARRNKRKVALGYVAFYALGGLAILAGLAAYTRRKRLSAPA